MNERQALIVTACRAAQLRLTPPRCQMRALNMMAWPARGIRRRRHQPRIVEALAHERAAGIDRYGMPCRAAAIDAAAMPDARVEHDGLAGARHQAPAAPAADSRSAGA